MNPARRLHWQSLYEEKNEVQTSWYRPHLDQSLCCIDDLELDKNLPVVDVGGGRSTLVDDLLARGYHDVVVLDLSAKALSDIRRRLGVKADAGTWIEGDVNEIGWPEARYELWHDRAVFHFLTEAGDRARYLTAAAHAVRPGGYLIIATFASDGPERCSGLPVRRYDATALAAEFTPSFEMVTHCRDLHQTPSGHQQPFTYVVLRRCQDSKSR